MGNQVPQEGDHRELEDEGFSQVALSALVFEDFLYRSANSAYIDVKEDSFLPKDLPPVLAQLDYLHPLLLQCLKLYLLCHGLALWQHRLQEVID